MRTDVLPSFSGNNDHQARRMNCSNTNSGSSKGITMTDDGRPKDTAFQETLTAVRSNNKMAERSANKKLDSMSSAHRDAATSSEVTFPIDPMDKPTGSEGNLETNGFTDNIEDPVEPPEDMSIMVGEEAAMNAEQIVKETLKEISDTLAITFVADAGNLSFREISSGTKSQFAEIIFSLKKLIQGFEFSSKNNIPVETPYSTIDGAEIGAMTDILRLCAFKMEVACNVLGISESVQNEVAQKSELTNVNGIVQASDPSSLMMASQHTDRLFGRMFADPSSSSSLGNLIDKIQQMFIENNGGTLQVTTGKATGSTSIQNDVTSISSSIYRALLKIDNPNQTDVQNETSLLKTPKLHLTESADSSPLPGSSTGDDVTSDDLGDLLLSDMKPGGVQQTSSGASGRIPALHYPISEESITRQITEKLQSVIRAGLSEIRIQLRPESLGEVKMRIRMEGDIVLGKIEVQNLQVKEIMERNLTSLKDALAQQNIVTGTFEIQIGGGGGRHGGWSSDNPWVEQEMTQKDGSESQHEYNENDNTSGADRQSGSEETGKRYGNNSVEFFA